MILKLKKLFPDKKFLLTTSSHYQKIISNCCLGVILQCTQNINTFDLLEEVYELYFTLIPMLGVHCSCVHEVMSLDLVFSNLSSLLSYVTNDLTDNTLLEIKKKAVQAVNNETDQDQIFLKMFE